MKIAFIESLVLILRPVFYWLEFVHRNDSNYQWTPDQFRNLVDEFLNFFLTMCKTRGIVSTVKYMKTMRNHFTRALSGKPFNSSGMMIGLNHAGYPKRLGFLLYYVQQGNPLAIRFCLTLLSIGRLIPGSGWTDLTSITAPSDANPTVIADIANFVSGVMKPAPLTNVSWKVPHFSMKSGPEVKSALIGSLQDFISIPMSMWNSLLTLGGSTFASYAKMITPMVLYLMKGKSPGKIRKISIIPDKECKIRPIAIFDYWSQTVLKPLHDTIMKRLSTIPTDMTYSQDAIKPLIEMENDSEYHSLDLSSATDRFPMALQHKVLTILTNKQFANSWRSIMLQPLVIDDAGNTVKYAAGQPMGAYSSWAVFTYCHHIVIQYSAWKVGLYPFTDYRILGDDVVIKNDAVAKQYKTVMNQLGVEISPTKSHSSKTTFEIAKRWFHNGTEVTPFPINALISGLCSSKLKLRINIPLLSHAFNTAWLRGWKLFDVRACTFWTTLNTLWKHIGVSTRRHEWFNVNIEINMIVARIMWNQGGQNCPDLSSDLHRRLYNAFTGLNGSTESIERFIRDLRQSIEEASSDVFMNVARAVEVIKDADEKIIRGLVSNFKSGDPLSTVDWSQLPKSLVLFHQLDEIRQRMWIGEDLSKDFTIRDAMNDISRLALSDVNLGPHGRGAKKIFAVSTVFMKIRLKYHQCLSRR